MTYIRSAALLLGSAVLSSVLHAQQPRALDLSGDVAGTHDPSIAKDGNTWYVFATGKTREGGEFAIRCSEDLHTWRLCGQAFEDIPHWIHERSPGTKELWAPDVQRVGNEFRMYYSYSLFGKNTSGIALAVNKTLDPRSPDYKWVDKGLVLESKATDNFNAIDPNFVQDAAGHGWLSFGSFWDGIKMRRLDDTTGLLSTADTRLYSLARRGREATPRTESTAGLNEKISGLPPDSEAIEAPFIVRHGGFFYLFTSWDLCCRGTHSTYHTMVGRSKSVTGPFLDRSGKRLEDGGGTALLLANTRWLGPGGESVLMAPNSKDPHQPDLIVFHAYDATSGKPSMQLSTIAWTDGWPHAALATQ